MNPDDAPALRDHHADRRRDSRSLPHRDRETGFFPREKTRPFEATNTGAVDSAGDGPPRARSPEAGDSGWSVCEEHTNVTVLASGSAQEPIKETFAEHSTARQQQGSDLLVV